MCDCKQPCKCINDKTSDISDFTVGYKVWKNDEYCDCDSSCPKCGKKVEKIYPRWEWIPDYRPYSPPQWPYYNTIMCNTPDIHDIH